MEIYETQPGSLSPDAAEAGFEIQVLEERAAAEESVFESDKSDPDDDEIFAARLQEAVRISSQAIEVFERTKLNTVATSWLDDTKEKGKQCVGFRASSAGRSIQAAAGKHFCSASVRYAQCHVSAQSG